MLSIGIYARLYTKGQKLKNCIYASGEEYSMANSNREFRKIPSLNFLYEVSKDGRSFRNVKSKKESKILVDYCHLEKVYRYTFVNIKGHTQKVSISKVVSETFGHNLEDIKDCNIYIVAVPTPVDENNRPDLKPLWGASETIGKVISKGDIVIYESTVYPGVTEEELFA